MGFKKEFRQERTKKGDMNVSIITEVSNRKKYRVISNENYVPDITGLFTQPDREEG